MPVFKKILESQRGGKILIDEEGYLYNYLRETAKGSTWACRAKYKLHCNSRVYYNEDGDIDMDFTVGHNHPPKPGEARTIEILRKLKTQPHAKYSYRVRKELMKGICNDDEDQDLPTLLQRKKRGRRTIPNVTPITSNLKPTDEEISNSSTSEPYTEVNVDDNPLNISSTQVNNDNLNIDAALKDVIQQLLTEPELLQSLVSSLSETEREMLDKLSNSGENTPTNTTTAESLPAPTILQATTLPATPAEGEALQQQISSANIQQLIVQGNSSSSPQMIQIPISTADQLRGLVSSGNLTSVASEGQATSLAKLEGGHFITLSDNMVQLCNSTATGTGELRQGCSTIYIAPEVKWPHCRQCRTTFSSEEELDHHFKSLKCCELCKIAFCVPKHYERHNELNHPDGLKSAWGSLCETCGRVFGVSFQLDSHRAKCSNRLSLRCPRCSFSFGFEEDLRRHKLLHTSDSTPMFSFSPGKKVT